MNALEFLQPVLKWTEHPEVYAELTGIPVEKIKSEADKLKKRKEKA